MASDNLVWIDCEFTGLDPNENRLIEIATIITDSELNIIAEGPSIEINQSDELLDSMDEWNTTHHTQSGLVEKVRASEIDDKEAERMTLEFVKQYTKPGRSPLCGNTISQDRRFLRRYMPELHAHFHYRSIDVSTVKELAKRWNPELDTFWKNGGHRALDDIRESVAELTYYREHFFK
ncbi:MAG TPA: oligoribonuclease [Candidatus Thalassarchaeaceae archaeon]|nr:oligoribonuclease [Candidatus Thalassarchaeaceae archaeon]